MAIQSFSVGQVLTAAQVNALQANDYNQTVSNKTASYTLVAADKGTRVTMSSTSATTITVNTSLFSAGDTLFIQNLNTGVSTITAGTATVTTSSSLALAQWEGGTLYFTSASAAIFFKSDSASVGGGSGLTFISRTTFSNVASQAFDDVFTSNYYSYIARIEYVYAATNSDDLQLQFRYAGPTTQTSGYYGATFEVIYNGVTTVYGANNASAGTLGGQEIGSSPQGTTAEINFNGVGNQSEIGAYYGISSNFPGSGLTIFNGQVTGTNRLYTGFLLKSTSSNITGAVSIYGLAKA